MSERRTMMQAIRVHETGDPDVLKLEEVAVPEPGPGQVRVKIEAVGVNFTEVYSRKGWYKTPLPATPGSEAAGVVDALGEGVTDYAVGQRVASVAFAGAYAQFALCDAAHLIAIPDGVETRVAAAVLLQGMTAHYLSHSTFPLQAGQVALVHAAGGATGQLLVQMAKRLGARILGTAGSEAKAALAREAGADDVILYTQTDFAAEARRLTGGAGVNVVYDSVGKDTFDGSVASLRIRGTLVLFGQSSGPVPPFDPQVLNAKGSLYLTRPTLVHYLITREELLWRANDIFSWIASSDLRVRIDTSFPLADAAEAHRYLEARKTQGKVLLLP
jgi:NADPH:quinone reductase